MLQHIPETLDTLFAQPNVKLLIDGEFRESQASQWVDVTNPVSDFAALWEFTRRE